MNKKDTSIQKTNNLLYKPTPWSPNYAPLTTCPGCCWRPDPDPDPALSPGRYLWRHPRNPYNLCLVSPVEDRPGGCDLCRSLRILACGLKNRFLFILAGFAEKNLMLRSSSFLHGNVVLMVNYKSRLTVSIEYIHTNI